MLLELIIGAVGLTLITVLVTGPGMWSSSWGWKSREKPQTGPDASNKSDKPGA
ncbi:hypothetical protein P2318_33635 [Myxococcaceae bacterium GXIMD 01537]